MNPFALLLIGWLIAVGGILIAGWHHIPALLPGAGTLGALTANARLQACVPAKGISPDQFRKSQPPYIGKLLPARIILSGLFPPGRKL